MDFMKFFGSGSQTFIELATTSSIARQIAQKVAWQDKDLGSDKICERVRAEGINPVVPRKSNSKKLNPEFDFRLDKIKCGIEWKICLPGSNLFEGLRLTLKSEHAISKP